MKVHELIEQLKNVLQDLDVVIYNPESVSLLDDYYNIGEVYWDDYSQLNQKIYLKPDAVCCVGEKDGWV